MDLAEVELQFGNPNEAIRHLNYILDENKGYVDEHRFKGDFEYVGHVLKAYGHRGKAYEALYGKNSDPLLHAYANFQEAINLIKQARKQFRSIHEAEILSEQYATIFSNAMRLSYQLYGLTQEKEYLGSVFLCMEMAKSNGLFQSLNRNQAIQITGIPDSTLQQVKVLEFKTTRLNSEIAQLLNKKQPVPSDSLKLARVRFELSQSEEQLKIAMLQLEEDFPNYYEANYRPAYADIRQVQSSLDAGELLLEYFVGEKHLYALGITQKETKVFQLDNLLPQQISGFLQSMQPEKFMNQLDYGLSDYVKQSGQLYQILLAEPLAHFKNQKIGQLYVIPDQSLGYLPFELLVRPTSQLEDFDFQSLPYLMKDFTVSYGYSSSTLFRETGNKSNPKNRILAIAPSYRSILQDTTKLASLGKFRDGFSELAFNVEEARQVTKYFNGEVLQGADATEQSFVDKAQEYDIFHFAMHALVDNEDSERSKLVFTPNADTIYDNYLHNFELYNMEMAAKMVVLSACNTGDGELASGEGVKSLAQAFTYAGAKSVVMSHWRVDDKASSKLMDLFYKYLAAGKSKEEALRSAKLEYLANASVHQKHPFHWGAFVVVGDTASLVTVAAWYQQWWIYLVLAVIALGSFLLFKRR